MAYDLVIFDCDGTLVNSEYLNNMVVAVLLAEQGLPQYTTAHCIEIFAGKGMHEVLNTVRAETGVALPPGFVAEYSRRVNENMAAHMQVIDGARETVGALHGRVGICVGSNGERVNVLAMVAAGGYGAFFPDELVFTKDMVENAKPAPDLFLLAARRLGADPGRTMVVEDSPTGVRAGVAAGMTVVGFTGSAHDPAAQERLLRGAGAHHITADFRDIMGLAGAGASLLTV